MYLRFGLLGGGAGVGEGVGPVSKTKQAVLS